MADDERQWALERFVGGIDELTSVLGPQAAPAVNKAKQELVSAIAARDRGDRGEAVAAVARAMAELAALGDSLGGAEGEMMRAVTGQLVAGLARDDRDEIERSMAMLQSRSGTPKKPQPD